MQKLIVIFFACFSTLAYGQSDIILLQGTVLNDTIEKASLNVVNVSLKKGAITNAQGQFTLTVRRKDTINISAVQYESRQVVVSDKIYSDRQVSLYLIPKVTVLENVNISDLELSGNLNTDALDTPENRYVLPNDLGLQENTAPERTTEERRLYTATTRGPDQVGRHNARFDIPLGGVINALTGKTKKLKKHIATSDYQRKVALYREQFADDFYTHDCNIPLARIEDFVFYAIDSEELPSTDKRDRLKLFEFYRMRAKKYLALSARKQ